MASEAPSGRDPGASADDPPLREVARGRTRTRTLVASLAAGALALVVSLIVLGALYRDALSTTAYWLGFASVCLWVITLGASARALLGRSDYPAHPAERERRPATEQADSPVPSPEDVSGEVQESLEGIWLDARLAFLFAACAAAVLLGTLGFVFAPGGGAHSLGSGDEGEGTRPTRLAVSWTVEEPMRVETAARVPPESGPILVVLRVTDPDQPECRSRYRWRVTSRTSNTPEEVGRRNGCTAEVRLLPEADYTIKVARLESAMGPAMGPAIGQTEARVQLLVVASFGDSVASGEGNPSREKPHWADGSRCNRSSIAGPRQAADRISAASDHAFVLFFHLACTGAWIDGVGAPTVWHPNIFPLLPETSTQLSQVGAFERRAKMHSGKLIVLLSIGANDIGFGPILRFCLKTTIRQCYKKKLADRPLNELVSARLAELRYSYERLAAAIPFRSARVYVTEYFDPLHDEHGQICRIWTIGKGEASWADRTIIQPLNRLVRAEAEARHWIFVPGIAEAFYEHGYCARESWIVHIPKAIFARNLTGGFHPNSLGQAEYGRRIFAAVKPYLDP